MWGAVGELLFELAVAQAPLSRHALSWTRRVSTGGKGPKQKAEIDIRRL